MKTPLKFVKILSGSIKEQPLILTTVLYQDPILATVPTHLLLLIP